MADLIIVDDEQSLLHSLQLELKRLGHSCHAFETAEQSTRHEGLAQGARCGIVYDVADRRGTHLAKN